MDKKFIEYGIISKEKITILPLVLKPVSRVRVDVARKNSRIRFGFLGTIHPLKNYNLISNIFKKIQGNASLEFHGMGRPEHISQLQQMIISDTRQSYGGKYVPEDLQNIFSNLDIVIVASITENYPLVVREAMSAGLPVIASRVGGIPEIIIDGVNGLLFNPDHPEELLHCLNTILQNPSLIEKFQSNLGPIKTMDQDAAEWIQDYSAILQK